MSYTSSLHRSTAGPLVPANNAPIGKLDWASALAPPKKRRRPRKKNQAQKLAALQDLNTINRALAERSLSDFIQIMWDIIEPGVYKHNWHIDVICEHLQAVTDGEIRRLIINIPPRHCKSTLVSVMWPAWSWIRRPGLRFMASSYAQNLSFRDSSHCRRIIESDRYLEWWGDRFRLTSDQNTKTRFENDRGGSRLATSVDGALTGEGGDIILVDDPHNVREKESDLVRQGVLDWWDEAMSTRLNDPVTGAYVIIMQRVHHQDLVGHLLAKDSGWTHLCLPARFEADHPHPCKYDRRSLDGDLLWPERFPESHLSNLEKDLGSYGAAGQLQQRPSPRSGGMFSRDWWELVPAAPAGGEVVRAWDLAGSKDNRSPWTAGVLMRRVGGVYYLEDMVRIRGTPSEVERLIQNIASQDGPGTTIDLPQDPGQAGKAQVRYLIGQLSGYNARSSLESGAKETRAEALSAQAEAGNVKLVRGDWNRLFIEEAALFPNSDYADQIDACSRAFHRLARHRRRVAASAVPQVNQGGY